MEIGERSKELLTREVESHPQIFDKEPMMNKLKSAPAANMNVTLITGVTWRATTS